MAVTAETRTNLIGLSVVMLGSAPGTDLLNEWVGAINDGMSLEDVAGHIAASDAFQATYPTFLTNEEFAESFLGNLMGDEDVSADLVTAAVSIVTGLLNDGMTRGALALAVVGAMYDIHAQGSAHDAYDDLGSVADGLFNKIEVAEYYTVDLRQTDSNSRVLRDVNSENGLDEVRDSISDHLDPPDPIYLTNSRDNIEGTAANDLIISELDERGDKTLDPFDTIDGGAGFDTLEIYDNDDIVIDANGADVMNVEHVYLSTRAAIDVNLSAWEDVESVELGRFGNTSDVSVTVAGAAVSTDRTFAGDVTITGAGGEVDITASPFSDVQIYSVAHTTSVSVQGGASIDVTGGVSASETVTSVSIDGVQRNLGNDEGRGPSMQNVINPAADMTMPNATNNEYYLDANGDPTTGETGANAAAQQVIEGSEDEASVQIHSKAIESVSLRNNEAIIAVTNGSDNAEDLAVTVDGFGSHTRDAGPAELSLAGDGAAENVSLTVAGDSDFNLVGDAITTLSVTGDGDLKLGVTKSDASVSGLESLTLSGGGGVNISVAGMDDLESIDASASSGDNNITGVGDSVESVSGGSGSDSVTVSGFASGGVAVDLGAGDDSFTAGAESTDRSSVDGGEGTDVLRLTQNDGSYTPSGATAPVTIYSNFEILDIGGSGEASYNVGLLGVNNVRITGANTSGEVTLTNMADGMGIGVYGSGDGVSASVVHRMPEREVGSARYSGEFDVSLSANGGADDTTTNTTGLAALSIDVDQEIEVLNITSNANAGGARSAANVRPSSGHYVNTLTLAGDDETVEAINVSGNAQVEVSFLSNDNANEIELVDAENNTAGVTVDVTGADGLVVMLGGSGGDTFTGSAQADDIRGNGGDDTLIGGEGNDTIRGGAGGDTLTGGAGDDVFDYTAASESQVAWTAQGHMYGFDFISGWDSSSADDTISLGRTLFNSLKGDIKATTGDDGIDSTSDAADTAADNLRAFLGDGDGIFETVTANPDGTFGSNIAYSSIATVTEVYVDDGGTEVNRIWVLIDVDGDGDFDAATDMAIAIAGSDPLVESDFTM